MKKNRKLSSLMLLTVLSVVPLTSHAQIGAYLEGSLNGASDGVLYATTNTAVKVNADAGANNTDQEGSFTIEGKTEIDPLLKVGVSGIAVTSASQVVSETDLKIYSENVSIKDPSVTKIEAVSESDGKSEIKVGYTHKGKFLGFLPINIHSTTVVEVEEDGEMKVQSRLPWWSFLVAKQNYNREDVESRVRNNETIKANAQVNASATSKAKVAEAIVAEVEASANTEVGVNK